MRHQKLIKSFLMLTIYIDLSLVSRKKFINNFQEKSEKTDGCLIAPGFFDVPMKVVLVDIPYYQRNEEFSKRFMKNVQCFHR